MDGSGADCSGVIRYDCAAIPQMEQLKFWSKREDFGVRGINCGIRFITPSRPVSRATF
jgi:hypothetical protein